MPPREAARVPRLPSWACRRSQGERTPEPLRNRVQLGPWLRPNLVRRGHSSAGPSNTFATRISRFTFAGRHPRNMLTSCRSSGDRLPSGVGASTEAATSAVLNSSSTSAGDAEGAGDLSQRRDGGHHAAAFNAAVHVGGDSGLARYLGLGELPAARVPMRRRLRGTSGGVGVPWRVWRAGSVDTAGLVGPQVRGHGEHALLHASVGGQLSQVGGFLENLGQLLLRVLRAVGLAGRGGRRAARRAARPLSGSARRGWAQRPGDHRRRGVGTSSATR